MVEAPTPELATFLEGLRSQVGKRIRIWYEVESSDAGPLREIAEGRLASVDSEVTLEESRLVHPAPADDHAIRTASVSSLRGYALVDPRTGTVTKTVLRPKGPSY